jgi:hypothetical protein
MKKIALFVAAVAVTASVSAQDITFGPTAGLNYSSISTSVDPEPEDYEAPDAASGIGFFIGGFANIGLSEKLAIRPELHFSSRGTKSESTFEIELFGTSVKSESTVKGSDSFLEIPILVNLMLSESFNVHVGPSIGLLVGSKATIDSKTTTTVGGSSVTEETSTEISGDDATEGRNGFELGLAAGVMYETEGGLGVGVRYTRALTDTSEETEFGDTTVNSNYNVIQLVLAYTLGK